MNMRPSRVLKKLRAGETVSCIKINFANAQVSEIASLAGFDCVWLDQEHSAQDWSVINSQVWSAKAWDTDTLVRIPRGSYSDLVKPLEMDATGIMVPHVMSAQDAKNIVRMTRFHPLGLRAIDGGNADGAYTNIDFNDYLEQANRERFVILQIEDPEPLKELEAIADVEGYDMLFFGPGDFSQGIGAPGQWNHPDLIAARKRVAEVANKYGKFAATTGGIDKLNEFVDMGYQFVSVGADVVGLSNYFKGLVNQFTNTAAEKTKAASIYK
ncbi:HpcH/HpaI aldolase family protein [Flavisolibacter ginsenosidimutans]|uniref:Aldolase n=1 Tax=Flavisolibacter ginsenosidimutans TaxID=661481 RepID=A0A5B8UDE9_9BACT|nr:aldolase/citrate lyase family protein [Flavisolibacter ginsenosidimutans]QEC54385.1 aldolase [Flavisolibacter ginsenosidimutans]